jgi:hypothetical protein
MALVRGGLYALRPSELGTAAVIACRNSVNAYACAREQGLERGHGPVGADGLHILDLMPGLITRHDANGNVVSMREATV